MGETLAIAAVAASVLSAGTSVAGGFAARGAGKSEARQYEAEARFAATAAAQEETERRRVLGATLATQDAIRAGRGVDLFSPTGAAIRDETVATAQRDIDNIRLNGMRTTDRYNLAARNAEARGTQAFYGGLAGGFGSLLGGARAGSSLLSGSLAGSGGAKSMGFNPEGR
jgi:hypothetical protein